MFRFAAVRTRIPTRPGFHYRGLAKTMASSPVSAHERAWVNPHPEDQFVVSPKHGFLPRHDPLSQLPKAFSALESLLQRMPRIQDSGKPGLLATGDFGKAVLEELPLYDVSSIEDPQLLSALYRDYTFAASAYLLEPCDLEYRRTGKYGLARPVLPKSIAVPLCIVADKLGAKPFMEYALSYGLYNFQRKRMDKPADLDNVSTVRGFTNTEDEKGFILVHVSMVRHSGPLVQQAMQALESAGAGDRQAFDRAMEGMATSYSRINGAMEQMWKASKTDGYINFRAFIMGSKNQPMFPQGIHYEGVDPDMVEGNQGHNGRFYRGESGANDSMIPLGDNLLELTSRMPSNPLTSVLRDFRQYRPRNHQSFLAWVESRASEVGIHAYSRSSPVSAALTLAVLDQIRDFRHRHWLFTKEYILKHTKHPVATGGSPIVTWLPNQLSAVLGAMEDLGKVIEPSKLPSHLREPTQQILERASTQKRILAREVADLVSSRSSEDGGRAVDGGMALGANEG